MSNRNRQFKQDNLPKYESRHAMTRDSRATRRISFGVVISFLLIIASFALSYAARSIPGFASSYTSKIYPILQGSYGRLTSLFPFSVSEMLLLALPVVLVIDIVVNRHRLIRVLKHLFVLASVLVFLYTANCGVNYYSPGFVSQSPYSAAYEDAQFSEDQLVGFCEYIVGKLNDNNFEVDSSDSAKLADSAVASMEKLGAEYDQLSGFYSKPKQLKVISRLFSKMGVSGIYSPFTIEANTNGEMPDMEKPFTSCHELSHLRGYMNEGEANFIGWLACIGSDDTSFNRSGWLIAWTYAGNELYRINPDKYKELWAKVPESAKNELRENNEFWSTHETKASEVQDKVNDAYLKSNGVEEGVASYGQLTTLMMLWYTSQITD